jgi:AcrR family transcriptional regulator
MTRRTRATPRQRLLEAAERLFADRGIDAVSLAEVTRAAGLGNTGAVHHYFGGREELLEAVVEVHRTELDARRETLLDDAEQLGPPTLDLVVRVLVEPMAEKLDDDRGRAFLSIQAQRTLRPRHHGETPRPLALRLLPLLGAAGLPAATVSLLADLGRDLAYAALAQRALVESEGGREAEPGRDEFVHELSRAIARLMRPDAGARRGAPESTHRSVPCGGSSVTVEGPTGGQVVVHVLDDH